MTLYMYQLTTNDLPDSIASLFTKNLDIHSYPTRKRNDFHTPRLRTSFSQKTIVYTGPSFWNNLHPDLLHSSSIHQFKYKLKLHLLNAYNNNDD